MKALLNSLDKSTIIFDALFAYISSNINSQLTTSEMDILKRTFAYKKIRKHQYLYQEGNVFQNMVFVASGCLRMYSVSAKGLEHTMTFSLDRTWICDHESFIRLSPTRYNTQALEDSELLMITAPDLHELMSQVPAIAQLIRRNDLALLIESQKRIHSAISRTAEDRYFEMMKQNPHIYKRISLALIASYLGITPETLSRVRKLAIRR